jgi:large subunit ribosomal protein L6
MSRVGKKPIELPKDITVTVEEQTLKAKGPKGELSITIHPLVAVRIEEGEPQTIVVSVKNQEEKEQRALWGLVRALVQNVVTGVTTGYEKTLEVNGVGYRVNQSDNTLMLEVGFSHSVEFIVPEGVEASVEKNTITIRGIDKQQVGEVAAQIRKIRPPEPYKGKGIKYSDEVIRRKAGKAVKGATAG